MPHDLRSKLHGKVLMPLAYFCQRDARFSLLDELLARDEWSPDQVRAHQAERLTSLFRVCWKHNPYWREKFRSCGVNPRACDPFAQLAKLPVLTKDELRKHWKSMRSNHLPARAVVHETSAGSTGVPANFWQSRAYRQLHAAMEYRYRAWMGIQPGEAYLCIHPRAPRTTHRRRLLSRLRLLVENTFIIDALHSVPERNRALLCASHRRQPAYVFGYTNWVVAVARLARDAGLRWPTVRAVGTTSEQLLDSDRTVLRQAFDATVYDRYGSREIQSISMQCSHGSHHIFSDLNYIEFVPFGDADEGFHAVVATPLDNEAMPLFRYRNGDSASPLSGSCPCGRTLPLMTGCRGRLCNNFLSPDGQLIDGTYFTYCFARQEGFKAYQFHQTSREDIDLFVVPDGRLSPERHEYLESCCASLREEFGFKVHLCIVEEIPATRGGKHLYTISDLLTGL